MISSSRASTIFSSLSATEQLRCLVYFVFNLTIAARDTYTLQESGLADPERMRVINEIQHRVCGHAIALLNGVKERRPDDDFVAILLEHNSDKVRSDTSWAFEQAIEALRRDG